MKGSGHPGFGHVAGEKGEKTRGRLTSRSLPPASLTIHPEQADPLLRKVHPRELGLCPLLSDLSEKLPRELSYEATQEGKSCVSAVTTGEEGGFLAALLQSGLDRPSFIPIPRGRSSESSTPGTSRAPSLG